jgi:Ca2+-binding EF-hand superfamily protein
LLTIITFTPALAKDRNKEKPAKEWPSFQQLDTNRDGKVSEEEYADSLAVKNNNKKGKGGDKRQEFFKAHDTDADGFWSETEYKAARKAAGEGRKDKEMKVK